LADAAPAIVQPCPKI